VPEPSSPEPFSPSAQHVRIIALLEVLICSDYPTQLAVGTTFRSLGFKPYTAPGALNASYVVGASIADTILLLGLILLFLYSHGERPRDVFVGRTSTLRELVLGVLLIVPVLMLAGLILLTIQRVAPYLHTVAVNPLQSLLSSRRAAWMFALMVIIAGGIREELQRAFLLHRFEMWLGGGTVGLIVTSAAFGIGHLLQGADAAIATGVLGAFWGLVYLRRRSAVAPIVSHSGFDLLQIAQSLVAR